KSFCSMRVPHHHRAGYSVSQPSLLITGGQYNKFNRPDQDKQVPYKHFPERRERSVIIVPDHDAHDPPAYADTTDRIFSEIDKKAGYHYRTHNRNHTTGILAIQEIHPK